MSPRGSRRSGLASYLVLIGVLALAWYLGKIPGLPGPETVIPKIKNLGTSIPSLEAARTLVPDVPVIGTFLPDEKATPGIPPPASSAGGLPDMPVKPKPRQTTFQGCPPEGDGGDPELNLLKNRVDEGDYAPVTFEAIAGLTWPEDVERRDRENWQPQDRAFIEKYEGIPVVVEGYIVMARESGPESTNCHGTESDMVDWHVWFTKNPNDDRSVAIITETTPRVRANHKWTIQLLKAHAIEPRAPVRISGWLFFDPEHPEHLGDTRGTLWEIHPIMQIEIFVDGRWVPLDELAG